MKSYINLIKRKFYILIIHIIYSITIFYALFKNREVIKVPLEQFADIKFVKELLLNEVDRFIFIGIWCSIFLAIIYYIISNYYKKDKKTSFNHLKDFVVYLLLTTASVVLWIPLYLIMFVCIAILLTPSGALAVLLFMGKESLFIPAIILWIITAILLVFALLLFAMYLYFWYPLIFLNTKNIFSALIKTSNFIKENYFRLIPAGIIMLVTATIYIFTIVKGFKLIYSRMNSFDSVSIWFRLISVGILDGLIKLYSFHYYNKEIKEEKEDDDEIYIIESEAKD